MDWTRLLSVDAVWDWTRVGLIVLVGGVVLRVVTAAAGRRAEARWNRQTAMLVRRGLSIGGWSLLLATALNQLGFELSVLMGAAGLLTVAVGFASQTAASNLISGLFLIGERPFVVGDVITVDSVTGEVTDIDLVSVKLRTFDNLLVRLPNEMLLKSRITNVTHYPIRRMDLPIGVSYSEDIRHVTAVLKATVDRLPLCLDEPEPLVIHLGFGDSSINLQLSVWAERPRFLEARTAVWTAVKEAFDAEGIEIPFPQRALHAGTKSAPLPVRVVDPATLVESTD